MKKKIKQTTSANTTNISVYSTSITSLPSPILQVYFLLTLYFTPPAVH